MTIHTIFLTTVGTEMYNFSVGQLHTCGSAAIQCHVYELHSYIFMMQSPWYCSVINLKKIHFNQCTESLEQHLTFSALT